MQVECNAEISSGSFLHYFRPAFGINLSKRTSNQLLYKVAEDRFESNTELVSSPFNMVNGSTCTLTIIVYFPLPKDVPHVC